MARRPLNGVPPITQIYGVANSAYRKGYHTGVDYGVGTDTAVLSPTNGTVQQVGDGRAAADGRGFFMIIRGDDGIYHNLYHLNRWHVAGGRVSEGQHVADSDNTGMSTGPHLHWETRRDNNTNDFNPADWLFATPAPAPAPAPTGGYMQPMSEAREAQLYLQYLGRPKEFNGASGRTEQKFFADALGEITNNNNARKELEGKVANLAGQIKNLTDQVNVLSGRPTKEDLAKLKDVADKAAAQATKDRERAEQLQRELDIAKNNPDTQLLNRGSGFLDWLKDLYARITKKG